MNRRSLLRSCALGATLTVAGCIEETSSQKAAESVRLDSISARNDSPELSRFNITVVRNGDEPYQGQVTLPSDEEVVIDSGWPRTGQQFSVTGMAKRFANYEVVAFSDTADSQNAYDVHFTITESGDVATDYTTESK